MTFFAGFEFLNLAGLWLGLAFPVLLWAYFYQGRFRKNTVASIMIMQLIPRKALIKRKLKLPLRFFLELLALCLLLLALAELNKQDTKTTAVLVLDNSLSMQAQTARGLSRFQEAQGKIKELISSAEFANYSLYLSSPQLTLLLDSVNKKVLLDTLNTLAPTAGPDRLNEELPKILSSHPKQSIYVFSDQFFSFDRRQIANLSATVLGEATDNIYIGAISLRRLTSDKASLLLQVNNSTQSKNIVDFTISLYSAEATPTLLATKKAQFDATTTHIEVSFELNELSPTAAYRVELFTTNPTANAIGLDDTAYVTSEISKPLRLLLLAPKFFASGLEQLKSVNLTMITPSADGQLPTENFNLYDLLIFYQIAPERLPAKPSLFVLPPTNPFFPLANDSLLRPTLTSWLENHPLTRYLRVSLLQPISALTINTPLWAQAVINSEEGALLVAGESHNQRLAALGFEIFPYEGAKTPLTTTLLFNLLSWLTESELATNYQLTGSSYSAPQGLIQTVTSLSGDTAVATVSAKQSFTFAKPGIYHVKTSDTPSTQFVAVNSLYPQESDTAQSLTNELSVHPKVDTASTSPTENNLISYLAWLAIFVLICETLFAIRPNREVNHG